MGLFTDDMTLANAAMPILVMYSISSVIGNMYASFLGYARALCLQFKASLITIGVHYLFCIPMALYLAFALDYKTVGLWVGYLCGVPLLVFFTGWLTLRSDWQKLSEKFERRIIADSVDT